VKHFVLLGLTGAALLALMACETGDTCDIRTSGIRVDYEAIEQDGVTTARAQFMYKDTSLELGNCGDTIEVNGVRLNSVGSEYPITYEADVEPNDSGEFEFVFAREDEGPFTSTTGLPETFELTAPASGESFSRAEPINVTWSGEDWDLMTIAVEAEDLWEYEETVSDVNAYSIAADELEAQSGAEDDDILAELILTRSDEGTVDAIFDSGSTCVGKVIDQVSFTSTP
jgi:hypothetical protein